MVQISKSKTPQRIKKPHTTQKNKLYSSNKKNESKNKTLKSSFTDSNFFDFSANMFSELEKTIQIHDKTYLRMFKRFERSLVSRKDESKISLSEFKTIIDNNQLNNIISNQHAKYMIKV